MLSFELILQGDRMPEVRRMLVEAEEQGKEAVDSEGRFYQTLLQGRMVQWLFSPETATDATQLTEGLRHVVAGVNGG
ncbi:hypothetical protein [Streptomyces guryensis]|uniref:Uncharacterized protein n=1 Tax=Streptomyces guryensis TaxID=2886947 RepID=A0A9Q3ZBR7_9ACTN|nr:hypothetical protein [Streptomyces guryensis]MCD9876630.1 hypothetical protein [Streptomyces guryensis]